MLYIRFLTLRLQASGSNRHTCSQIPSEDAIAVSKPAEGAEVPGKTPRNAWRTVLGEVPGDLVTPPVPVPPSSDSESESESESE